jgi:hypothetical protein
MISMTEIPQGNGLDAITVFWHDIGSSEGSVTITCFGCAWTAYFRAMSGRTIQRFFKDCDVEYLVTKLGITPLLKQRKADHSYLAKIVGAIKSKLEETQ